MKTLHEQYLRGGLGMGVVLKIKGPEDGGADTVQFFNTETGAQLALTASEFKEAAERFHEVEYQESPFESFVGAASVAMALENYAHYDGTRLVTILAVRRSEESGYYGIEVNVKSDPNDLPNVRTLWRNRDVRDLRTFLDELRYKPVERPTLRDH